MNYLSYPIIKENEEQAYLNYIDHAEKIFHNLPYELQPILDNTYKELYLIPSGSLNFKIDNSNNLSVQIPYTVILEHCSIGEFLLFNLTLKSDIGLDISYYNTEKNTNDSINLSEFQNYLTNPVNFSLNSLCWDISDNNKIELNLNFSIKNDFCEIKICFFKEDILSAKIRTPNYSEEDYISLKQSGENDTVGYNRIEKILNIFEKNFKNRQLQLI